MLTTPTCCSLAAETTSSTSQHSLRLLMQYTTQPPPMSRVNVSYICFCCFKVCTATMIVAGCMCPAAWTGPPPSALPRCPCCCCCCRRRTSCCCCTCRRHMHSIVEAITIDLPEPHSAVNTICKGTIGSEMEYNISKALQVSSSVYALPCSNLQLS